MNDLDRRAFVKVAGAGLSLPSITSFLASCGEPSSTLLGSAQIKPTLEELPVHEHWWLSGNYAPVAESEAQELEIIGEIPRGLDGTYVRNGPNPVSGESGHWFGGDGMLHGVRIEDGQAPWYRAQYIDTDFYREPPEPGSIPDLKNHQANTSIVRHADRWLCLAEGGLPYEVDADLVTTGVHDYEGGLEGPMTAHPKVDPSTGELHFFGYRLFPPSLKYYTADASGQLIHSAEVALPAGAMIHDFQLTDSHVIFMDLPVLFDLELAIAGDTIPFRWAPEHQSRIGVLPRRGEGTSIQWFNIEPCFVFHTINAYNDPQNSDEIVLSAVRYPDIWKDQTTDFGVGGEVWRWRINVASGEVNERRLDRHLVEFPVINPLKQGMYHRYGYAIGTPNVEQSRFSAVIKYDFEQGIQEMIPLALPYHLGELKFIPALDASREDQGWLIGYGYNSDSQRSELIILDAAHLSETPKARILIPTRVPFGFHGDWFPS